MRYRMATATASPSSSTSLTLSFSVLREPKMFSCISSATNIPSSYSYRRALCVMYDGTPNMFGTSAAKIGGGSSFYLYSTGSSFSMTYESGTLTITSAARNTGGYFANVTYTLLYAY